jgi:phosphoenolpyruvate carboxykinase (GTP)
MAATSIALTAITQRHPAIVAWVEELTKHLQPDRVRWIDGSAGERGDLLRQAVADGVLIPLDQGKLPGCYYHRSHPSDVARVEDRTFICTATKDDAGPTNNWADPAEMKQKLLGLLAGSYRGRTLYVIPYLMGPAGCPRTLVGVELTDSIYVVLSMGVMTRMGTVAMRELERQEKATGQVAFNRGIHSTLDLSQEKRYIAHFPQDNTIISTASNYGGNVLLGKKCLALRIGSWLGRQQGWFAEHMLIMKVENPQGEATFVAAAFPSACGKTNFAMLIPPERYQGWKVTTVGDDIAWMWVDEHGQLRAMNPENGYFGVAPGTNSHTNPNAMATIAKDTIYTNVGLTYDGNVWWEGKDGMPPHECLDWRGNAWTHDHADKAAHPNSRFASPMSNNPALAKEAMDPAGVPISALIFGGRRASVFPLVFQAFNWAHGVYLGATMGSEMTAAAAGVVGQVRRDPMAMLPFCGYNMGDYFGHWLAMGRKIKHPPRIFHVNWFRKDANGKFLWPGFGDNMRVLQWIVDRCHGRAEGEETALGWMPPLEAIDLNGLEGYSRARLGEALAINLPEWKQEIDLQGELFAKLGDRMPKELLYERELLRSRLGD